LVKRARLHQRGAFPHRACRLPGSLAPLDPLLAGGRQRSRLGAAKAITALAHKLARIVYHLVRYGLAYVKQTEAAYAAQVCERLERQLRRRAMELGFALQKIEPPAIPTVTEA
jgi:hypothetical protein